MTESNVTFKNVYGAFLRTYYGDRFLTYSLLVNIYVVIVLFFCSYTLKQRTAAGGEEEDVL